VESDGNFRVPLTLQNPVVALPTVRFNIKKFCVLPTKCIDLFFMDVRTTITSLHSITGLVFITETENVYCAVRTGS